MLCWESASPDLSDSPVGVPDTSFVLTWSAVVNWAGTLLWPRARERARAGCTFHSPATGLNLRPALRQAPYDVTSHELRKEGVDVSWRGRDRGGGGFRNQLPEFYTSTPPHPTRQRTWWVNLGFLFIFIFFLCFLNQMFLCEGIHLTSGQQVHSYVIVGGEGSLKILSKVTAQGEKRRVTLDISR